MQQLIYFSQATVPFNESQLAWLLRQARTFNAAHGITGILLYGNEQFLQVLEGEPPTVQALYAHIRQDPRHRSVVTYADHPIAERAFTEWNMAFQPLAPRQFTQFASCVSPAEVHLERENLREADQQLLQLLRTFILPTTS